MKRNYIAYVLMSLICISSKTYSFDFNYLTSLACGGAVSLVTSVACLYKGSSRALLENKASKEGTAKCTSERMSNLENAIDQSFDEIKMYQDEMTNEYSIVVPIDDTAARNAVYRGDYTQDHKIGQTFEINANNATEDGYDHVTKVYNSAVRSFNDKLETYRVYYPSSTTYIKKDGITKNNEDATRSWWDKSRNTLTRYNELKNDYKRMDTAVHQAAYNKHLQEVNDLQEKINVANKFRYAGYATGLLGMGCLGTYCYFKYYKNN